MWADRMIGQDSIRRQLSYSIEENRVSHAQLFLGKTGYGTLPLMLDYAQKILCAGSANQEACYLKCDRFSHPDLHFCFPIVSNSDKKKNTSGYYMKQWHEVLQENPYISIEDWLENISAGNKQGIINVQQSEEIVKDLTLKPYESDYRIMIIWHLDKMNPSASNKILKLIEEPPPKTVFLMTAEDQEKILTTILSRCQITKVGRIETEALRNSLKKEFDLDENHLESISHLADGNYQEAVRHIKDSEALHFNRTEFIEWMRMTFTKNVKGIADWSDKIHSIGRERQKNFLEYGIHMLRNCLLINNEALSIVQLDKEEQAFAKNFAPFVNGDAFKTYMQEFEKAEYHIERNGYAKLIFFDLSCTVMKELKKKRR